MWELLYKVVLAYASLRVLRGVLRLHTTTKWLKVNAVRLKKARVCRRHKFYILVPVLREQEIIKETFSRFTSLQGEYNLIFITTQKEDHQRIKIFNRLQKNENKLLKTNSESSFLELTSGIFPASIAGRLFGRLKDKGDNEVKMIIEEEYWRIPHTRDILKGLIRNGGNSKKVFLLDYPYKDGLMSHQLNFACEFIASRESPQTTMVVIYNADSVVESSIINDFRKFLRLYPQANVIQQSAIFLNNFNDFFGTCKKYFLQAVALLQSQWTLCHEIPRILCQTNGLFKGFFEGGHVVGHGLCVRLNILKKIGYFPTRYLNEDLPLGYLLRLHGEKIFQFPILENADSPTTIKSMFGQYKVWFYGLASYPVYIFDAVFKLRLPKLKAFLWGLRYFIRAFLWLFLSFTWTFLFLYPIIIGNWEYFFISFILFCIYAPLGFYIILNKLGNGLEKSWPVYLMSFPAYFTHSFGPILAVREFIFKIFLGQKIEKVKTER